MDEAKKPPQRQDSMNSSHMPPSYNDASEHKAHLPKYFNSDGLKGNLPQGNLSPTLGTPDPSLWPGKGSIAGRKISPLLSLSPLKAWQLPAHPKLAKLQAGHEAELPDMRTFVLDLARSASVIADQCKSGRFKDKGTKQSPPSAAPVQLLSQDFNNATWFARVSKHEHAPKSGTADWHEFVDALYTDHSVHEADYTPSIFDAHKILDWHEQLEKSSAGEGDFRDEHGQPKSTRHHIYHEWGLGTEWRAPTNVEIEIYEMAHKIPTPLANRVFATLVVRMMTNYSRVTKTSGGKSTHEGGVKGTFVVVQVPVDISELPEALYSNGRNQREGDTSQKRSKVVMGVYSSIELVEFDPKHSKGADNRITWTMATASDAKGNLPLAMQKMGVQSAIIKDVGYVLQWTADKRKSVPLSSPSASIPSSATTKAAAKGASKPGPAPHSGVDTTTLILLGAGADGSSGAGVDCSSGTVSGGDGGGGGGMGGVC